MFMLHIVGGILVILLSFPVGSIITEMSVRKAVMIALWILGAFLIVRGKKLWGTKFPHVTGLPIAENTLCSVFFSKGKLTVRGAGQEFALSEEKITDVSVATSTQIQKSYVSDAGGAVAGAMMFGPLGAMVGGRAKEMTSKVDTHYLIVTYSTEGEVKYFTFKAEGRKLSAARSLQQRFKKTHTPQASAGPIDL